MNTAMPVSAVAREYLPELKAEAARRWLASFCALLDPSYSPARHTSVICDHLERLERGEIDRLAMFMPPRHSKTYHVSQRFPAWYLGRNPNHQLILASYGAELAESNSRVVRNLLNDQRYPFDVRVATDSSAVGRWGTDSKGVVIAAGVGGAMTGFGAHLLVIDDPVKGREEADSETYRERAWEWYAEVARTRLMPGGKIVACQTRWHEDDLAGRILDHGGDRWTVVEMPAVDPDGQALWPEWFDMATLDDIKADIGSRAWTALYQQRPTAEEGGMFKRAWFTRRYAERPRVNFKALILDSAWKLGVMNDYSVIAEWSSDPSNYYVDDIWRDRVEMPDLRDTLLSRAGMVQPNAIWIEDTSAGIAIIQELRRDTRLPIIPVKVTAPFPARAAAVTPTCEAMKVVLPLGASWTQDFIDEHAAFPTGTHDDMVATTVIALTEFQKMLPVPQASRMAVTSGGGAPRQEKVWWQEPARGRR